MGLPGRDVRLIEKELTTLRLALERVERARSIQQFNAGIARARHESLAAAARIRASGRPSQAAARVVRLRDNHLVADPKRVYEAVVDDVLAVLASDRGTDTIVTTTTEAGGPW